MMTTDNPVADPAGARYPDAFHAAADYLQAADLPVLFGLPGDDLGVLPALESTGRRLVLCRDQRNAVFMAAGYALQSGRPGVCVVGKGPAVTNAVTGMLEAYSAGAPVVLLAGGTASDRIGSGALQELDQVPLLAPVTGWAHRVDHPDAVVPALERAFLVATAPRRTSVYLEFPDHLLGTPVTRNRPWTLFNELDSASSTPSATGAGAAALRSSRRPVLLVGGGMRHRNGDGVVERFAETFGAAIVATASGRGVVGEDHPLFCGLAGLYAPPGVEPLWRDADLVIAVGTRLEETATEGWDLPLLHVDVDATALATCHRGVRVLGDGADVLAGWIRDATRPPDDGWRATVAAARSAAGAHAGELLAAARAERHLRVVEVLAAIEQVVPDGRILVQENGLQDMWSYFYPHYTCSQRGGSVVPSEQTTLGFGAAAAAGVRVAAPDRPVVAFVGDGAFNLFRSDLETVARDAGGITYVVLRNGGYGWLDAQLGPSGLDQARYPFVDRAGGGFCASPEVCGDDAPVVHLPVPDRATLPDALTRAGAVTARGGVAVLHVVVDLHDRHPRLAALIDGEH